MIVFTELPPTSSAHVQLVGFVERLYDEERRGGHSYGEVDGVVVHPADALELPASLSLPPVQTEPVRVQPLDPRYFILSFQTQTQYQKTLGSGERKFQ